MRIAFVSDLSHPPDLWCKTNRRCINVSPNPDFLSSNIHTSRCDISDHYSRYLKKYRRICFGILKDPEIKIHLSLKGKCQNK